MEDLNATNPQVEEVAAPTEEAADQPEIENEDELTSEDDEGQDEQQAEPEEEYDEFEDEDGKKYRIPKAVVPKLMMQRDYTQKTQELAEQRRQIEAQRQESEQSIRLREELFQESAQLHNVEQRLAAYRNVNWQAWQAQDPQGAQAALAEYTTLRDVHANLQGQIRHKASELDARKAQETASITQRAVEHLSKPNPKIGWDGKFDGTKREALTKFGMQLGFTNEELSSTTHPLMIQTLNLALIGYETLAKAQQVKKPAAPVQAKPVPKVAGGKTTATTVNPDKLNTDQWLKWREEQLSKHKR